MDTMGKGSPHGGPPPPPTWPANISQPELINLFPIPLIATMSKKGFSVSQKERNSIVTRIKKGLKLFMDTNWHFLDAKETSVEFWSLCFEQKNQQMLK